MKNLIYLFISCFIALSPLTSYATGIEQNDNSTGYYFGYGVFGQSFTATSNTGIDAITVAVGDWNKHLGNTLSLKMNLYSGSGFSGALLATDSDTLINWSDNSAWWTFNFNQVNLTAGNTYTFSIDSIDGDRGGIYMSSNDPYSGGTMWLDNEIYDRGQFDLAFRIPFENSQPVPEPSTLILLGGGLLSLGFARKRFAKK